jgi:hypothetical protein
MIESKKSAATKCTHAFEERRVMDFHYYACNKCGYQRKDNPTKGKEG